MRLGARGGRKIIGNIPSKIHNSKNKYIFIGVPEGFQLPRSWRDIDQLNDKSPTMSKKEAAQWKKIVNFPRDRTDYSDLVSVTLLMEPGSYFLQVSAYTRTVLDFNVALWPFISYAFFRVQGDGSFSIGQKEGDSSPMDVDSPSSAGECTSMPTHKAPMPSMRAVAKVHILPLQKSMQTLRDGIKDRFLSPFS